MQNFFTGEGNNRNKKNSQAEQWYEILLGANSKI